MLSGFILKNVGMESKKNGADAIACPTVIVKDPDSVGDGSACQLTTKVP